jgi:hypothetical protein
MAKASVQQLWDFVHPAVMAVSLQPTTTFKRVMKP